MTKHYRSSIHGRVRIWHSYIYIYCFIVRKNSGQSRISTVVLASSRTYTSCKTFRPKASSRSNLALPNPDLNRMRQGSNRQQGCMGCIAAIGCRSVEGPFVEFQASFMERVQREVSQKEQELLDEAWFNVVTMWSPCGHHVVTPYRPLTLVTAMAGCLSPKSWRGQRAPCARFAGHGKTKVADGIHWDIIDG